MIKIKDIEVYHGKNKVKNEKYVKYLEKQGKDVKHFFEDVFGRNSRYLKDKDETRLIMSLEVIKKLFKKTNIFTSLL